MTRRPHTKIVHEGDFAAEVDIDLIYSEGGWSPYLTLEDAQKLDEVRLALRSGDLRTAREHARVFRLIPVAA